MKPLEVSINNIFVKYFLQSCADEIPNLKVVQMGTPKEKGYTPFICSSSEPYDFFMLGVIVTDIVNQHAKLIRQYRNNRNSNHNSPGSRSDTR